MAELWRENKKKLFITTGYCYKSGELPDDFVESRTYLIYKKGDTTEHNNYGTICLVPRAKEIH